MIEQISDTVCKYKCMLDMDIVYCKYILDIECLYKYNIISGTGGIAYVNMYQYIDLTLYISDGFNMHNWIPKTLQIWVSMYRFYCVDM